MSLGCPPYTLRLMQRGGQTSLGQFPRFTRLTYGRHLDETVNASLTVPTGECCELLANVYTWGTELAIFRGDERVWEGPFTDLLIGPTSAILTASDVSAWLTKRWPTVRFAGKGDAVTVAALALDAAFDPDDPNVLRYVQKIEASRALEVKAVQHKYASNWYDYLTQIAGLDWTVLGRAFLLMPTGMGLATGIALGEDDFNGDIQVHEDGGAAATSQAITNATKLLASSSTVDDFYGLLQDVTDVSGSDPVPGTLHGLAHTKLLASHPVPLSVVVPPGSTLSRNADVSFSDLVPGVVFDVRAGGECRPITQPLRLLDVDVTVDSTGEQIAVTFGNATDIVRGKTSDAHIDPPPFPPGGVPIPPGAPGPPVEIPARKCESLFVTYFKGQFIDSDGHGGGSSLGLEYSVDDGATWTSFVDFDAESAGLFANLDGSRIDYTVGCLFVQVPVATTGHVLVRATTDCAAAGAQLHKVLPQSSGRINAATGSWTVALGGGSRTWTAAGAGPPPAYFITAAWDLGIDEFHVTGLTAVPDTFIVGSTNPITVTFGVSNYVSGIISGMGGDTCTP